MVYILHVSQLYPQFIKKQYSDWSFDVDQTVKLEKDVKDIRLEPDEDGLNRDQWEMIPLKSCQV